MGTRLIQQRRGRGGPTFRAPSHRYFAEVKYDSLKEGMAQVTGFVDDPARNVLIAELLFEDGGKSLVLACEGLKKNDCVFVKGAELSLGNVMFLKDVPDGTPVFNVEARPGDGGKIARSSGVSVSVVSHDEDTGLVTVMLCSKRARVLNPGCLVTVGIACGGGRKEKPFVKAGNKFFAMRGRNKYYPRVRGTAMSAYDHPHGGKSLGKPSTVARSTPPGRKVGHVAARRTGRRKMRSKGSEELMHVG